MTYKEYAEMSKLMQNAIPAPMEYIVAQLGPDRCESICKGIRSVFKENGLSVEQAEVMLDYMKALLMKASKV